MEKHERSHTVRSPVENSDHLIICKSLINRQEKKFTCDQCGKGFRSETQLKRHLAIHSVNLGDHRARLRCNSSFLIQFLVPLEKEVISMRRMLKTLHARRLS